MSFNIKPIDIVKRFRRSNSWICGRGISYSDIIEREKFKKILLRLKNIKVKIQEYDPSPINPIIVGIIFVNDRKSNFKAVKVLGNWKLLSIEKKEEIYNSKNLLIKINFVCLEYERKINGKKRETVKKILKMINKK